MRCNAIRKDKAGRTIVGNMPEFDENRQFTEAQDLPGHIAKMTKQPPPSPNGDTSPKYLRYLGEDKSGDILAYWRIWLYA